MDPNVRAKEIEYRHKSAKSLWKNAEEHMSTNGYNPFAFTCTESGTADPLPFSALRLLKTIKLHLMTDFWIRRGTKHACTTPQINLIYQLQKVIEFDTAKRVQTKGKPKRKPRNRARAIEDCFTILTSEDTKNLDDCQICTTAYGAQQESGPWNCQLENHDLYSFEQLCFVRLLEKTGDFDKSLDVDSEEDSEDDSKWAPNQDLEQHLDEDEEDVSEYVFSEQGISEIISRQENFRESSEEEFYYTDMEDHYYREEDEEPEKDSPSMPLWMRVLLTWRQKRDFDFIFMGLTEGEIIFMYENNQRPWIREQPGEPKCGLRPIFPSNAPFFQLKR
ncbi:hypothetical protein DL95DRAFT_452638 [Leptodontidium sp. 2 PMI_412]|nr:hypothetical protein DL95DRAFT_452638 [Leptodontidium sp. 2 PMI_412]